MTNDTECKRNIVAFLQLLGRFRGEDASIYNAVAPGYNQFSKAWNEMVIPALDYLPERVANLREALSPDHLPFHDCGTSDLCTFADGMISTIILGKCC